MNRWSPIAAALALSAWACSPDASKNANDTTKPAAATTASTDGADLIGAGATFPYPLYSKWISQYQAKTGMRINYQSIGSGGGIKQLQDQTVDFGASDAPMSETEMAAAKGGPVMHIPTVVGLVAIAYNVPSITQPLKLSGAVIADIFLGKITKWNDTRIASLNAGVTLPTADILVVHRSEGSGTTFIFTDYLSEVSPAWKAGPGKGKDVQWPVGLGSRGNEGVSGQIKQTPNSLGYLELAYVKQNGLGAAAIQNSSGQFITPSPETATAAADAAVAKLPANSDYRVSIVNSAGAQAYPITSFTWLLAYRPMTDPVKAKKFADFVRWALNEGGKEAAALDYAPLPAGLTSRLLPRIDSVVPGTPK